MREQSQRNATQLVVEEESTLLFIANPQLCYATTFSLSSFLGELVDNVNLSVCLLVFGRRSLGRAKTHEDGEASRCNNNKIGRR